MSKDRENLTSSVPRHPRAAGDLDEFALSARCAHRSPHPPSHPSLSHSLSLSLSATGAATVWRVVTKWPGCDGVRTRAATPARLVRPTRTMGRWAEQELGGHTRRRMLYLITRGGPSARTCSPTEIIFHGSKLSAPGPGSRRVATKRGAALWTIRRQDVRAEAGLEAALAYTGEEGEEEGEERKGRAYRRASHGEGELLTHLSAAIAKIDGVKLYDAGQAATRRWRGEATRWVPTPEPVVQSPLPPAEELAREEGQDAACPTSSRRHRRGARRTPGVRFGGEWGGGVEGLGKWR